MASAKIKTFHMPRGPLESVPGARILGIEPDDSAQLVRLVQKGFHFKRLVQLQKASALPWEGIARFTSIPQRTIARRQKEGRLHSDESDRVLRASRIFDLATDLFMGDAAQARQWLESPQRGLGGQVPLDYASTDAGAREVEYLIIRLQHGVFA